MPWPQACITLAMRCRLSGIPAFELSIGLRQGDEHLAMSRRNVVHCTCTVNCLTMIDNDDRDETRSVSSVLWTWYWRGYWRCLPLCPDMFTKAPLELLDSGPGSADFFVKRIALSRVFKCSGWWAAMTTRYLNCRNTPMWINWWLTV